MKLLVEVAGQHHLAADAFDAALAATAGGGRRCGLLALTGAGQQT